MEFDEIIEKLPNGYEEACRETGALSRKRVITSPKDLLKLCLFYGQNNSLIEVAYYAKEAQICNISDVGFMSRFSNCGNWLKWINEHMIPEEVSIYEKPELLKEYRVLAVDASEIVTGGKAKNHWRLHYAQNIFSMSSAMFSITDQKQGETLKNFEFCEKDLVLADRAYATITGIEYCLKRNASFVLRIRSNAFNIYTEDGTKVTFSELFKNVTDECCDFYVYYKNSSKEMKPLRICAKKKTPEQMAETQRRMERQESKKQLTYSDECKKANECFFVVTSLDERFSAEQIIEIYRLRWQIEMLFKRYKSILQMGTMPTRNPKASEAWLNCKLLIALIIEKMITAAAQSADFSPSSESQEYLERDEDILFMDFQKCF